MRRLLRKHVRFGAHQSSISCAMAYCRNVTCTGTPKRIILAPLIFASAARAQQGHGFDTLNFPYRWLGDFVSQAEKAAAFAWAQGVTPDGLRQALFQRASPWRMGALVRDLILSPVPARLDQLARSQCLSRISFQRSASYNGVRNYLDNNAIDSALLLTGVSPSPGLPLEIFPAAWHPGVDARAS